MDSLIIVCLSSGNHYEWLREGARRLADANKPLCVRLLCVRRLCWRTAPSVSCNAGEGVQVSHGEGLGNGRVKKRMHTHETEKESPCNGQYARQR